MCVLLSADFHDLCCLMVLVFDLDEWNRLFFFFSFNLLVLCCYKIGYDLVLVFLWERSSLLGDLGSKLLSCRS